MSYLTTCHSHCPIREWFFKPHNVEINNKAHPDSRTRAFKWSKNLQGRSCPLTRHDFLTIAIFHRRLHRLQLKLRHSLCPRRKINIRKKDRDPEKCFVLFIRAKLELVDIRPFIALFFHGMMQRMVGYSLNCPIVTILCGTNKHNKY